MPIPLVTRILVADDHPIVRSGLKKVIDAQPDMEVVAEAEDGAEAVKKALSEDVHLAILDVSMPKTTGIQAADELHKRKPELKLLMLSMYDSEQFLFESLKAGASGYVLKYFVDRGRPEEEQFDILTPRELQVLKLIAEAYTSKEIAQELVISVKTVERHRQNILDKLGMSDRVELTRYAIRRGLIQP
jgi:DNA-binding NarL/FixJ family response regulator